VKDYNAKSPKREEPYFDETGEKFTAEITEHFCQSSTESMPWTLPNIS
jgi:hypothetical protein